MTGHNLVLELVEDAHKVTLGADLALDDLAVTLRVAGSIEEYLGAINEIKPDLVLTDFRYGQFDGIEAIRRAKEKYPDVVIIIFTEIISEFEAIECIKAGVSNILNKDQLSGISMIIQETLNFHRTRIEKRLIEEQLAREREILAISLASIGEAIITIDLSDEIVLFNRAAQRITGYGEDEAVGKRINEVLHIFDEKTNSFLDNPIDHLLDLEEKQKKNLPYKHPILLTKNKVKVLISGQIAPVQIEPQKNLGYVLIFDDVTEKELKAAQSLLSSKMESIGQLAAGIAHEINTPIQYLGDNLNYLERSFHLFSEFDKKITSFLEQYREDPSWRVSLKDFFSYRDDKKLADLFLEIPNAIQESQEGVNRVKTIVQAIREFSHPSLKEKSFADLNKAIQTTVTISKNEWKYCADLETDLDESLPLVFCRIDEINQVLLNIIINAAHAIREGIDPSSTEKGKIKIKSWHKGKSIAISISDTGCGISEEILNRIFDPFFTTKDVGKGTGQGLYLAHNIITKHHGGIISVKSKLGSGSTFTIELPIQPLKVKDDPG